MAVHVWAVADAAAVHAGGDGARPDGRRIAAGLLAG